LYPGLAENHIAAIFFQLEKQKQQTVRYPGEKWAATANNRYLALWHLSHREVT
jgi:hypothetical protein